jgi:hypothetical protein
VRLRKLTAAALAVLAVTGLTACKSKAGVAAVIDGHRISESDVTKYVTHTGPSSETVQQAAAQGQQVLPKSTVVHYLVQVQVFERVLARNGGVPSDAELASLRDQAAATLLQISATGRQLDDYVNSNIAASGFSRRFPSLLFRAVELEMALISRSHATRLSELAAVVGKAHLAVSVNPRYGKWEPSQVAVSNPAAAVPSFVKLPTASQAPAA